MCFPSLTCSNVAQSRPYMISLSEWLPYGWKRAWLLVCLAVWSHEGLTAVYVFASVVDWIVPIWRREPYKNTWKIILGISFKNLNSLPWNILYPRRAVLAHVYVMTEGILRILATRDVQPICHRCRGSLHIGDKVVSTRGERRMLYHSDCWESMLFDPSKARSLLTKLAQRVSRKAER